MAKKMCFTTFYTVGALLYVYDYLYNPNYHHTLAMDIISTVSVHHNVNIIWFAY